MIKRLVNGSCHRYVSIPSNHVIINGAVRKGDKVYRWRDDMWIDYTLCSEKLSSDFFLVIRPIHTDIGWDIVGILNNAKQS